MPLASNWYSQIGCQLYLSKTGSRAVILSQSHVRGLFQSAPNEIIQVDRKPTDIGAGIERAVARFGSWVACGVNLEGQIELTEYPLAAWSRRQPPSASHVEITRMAISRQKRAKRLPLSRSAPAPAPAKQCDAQEPIPGVHVEGPLTLGKNIGALDGIEMAYSAYKKHQVVHGKAPVTGGLTGDQRFFLACVQTWQAKFREGAAYPRMLPIPSRRTSTGSRESSGTSTPGIRRSAWS
jgi:hypothetical protein